MTHTIILELEVLCDNDVEEVKDRVDRALKYSTIREALQCAGLDVCKLQVVDFDQRLVEYAENLSNPTAEIPEKF